MMAEELQATDELFNFKITFTDGITKLLGKKKIDEAKDIARFEAIRDGGLILTKIGDGPVDY